MMYRDNQEFSTRFTEEGESFFAPGDMGEDFILGINGPLTSDAVDQMFSSLDRQIGFTTDSIQTK